MTQTPLSAAMRLRSMTPARVRLDTSLGPTSLEAVLDFQACHAMAKDALKTSLDVDGLAERLHPHRVVQLHGQPEDRNLYILRPDLGRRLRPADAALLNPGPYDLSIVIADGLSPRAVNGRAAEIALGVMDAMPDMVCAPLALVRHGRVAIGDEIASRMGSRLCLILIGERPGLSVSDSVGAYLTYRPEVGTKDSARNCVSNIHDNGGLSLREAVVAIVWLLRKADEIAATGVVLKDDRMPAVLIA